ncbi:MAG: hypothetical protein K1X94_23965 [Sandaracinaceae bacterium]|nr:hypothetical protein [Sandaracinaceae bacterium]
MAVARAVVALALGSVGVGCTYHLPPLDPRVSTLPTHLSQAGLYADPSLERVCVDCLPYTPRFELWSDGAQKRRWVRLPEGSQIDTSDMDDWQLPVGTELWKEFAVDGRRIETRLLRRVGPGPDDWVGVAYVWNAEQTDAILTIDTVNDALETSHDVPEARACMTCHGGRASVALGFSAIELAHDAAPGETSLDDLAVRGLLTHAPTSPLVMGGSETEVAALGYLHANCGSCHNSDRPPAHDAYRPPEGLDLWLTVGTLSDPATSPTYRSSLGRFVRPGQPDDSAIVQRVRDRVFMGRRMPPIAVERVDQDALGLLRRWVDEMP